MTDTASVTNKQLQLQFDSIFPDDSKAFHCILYSTLIARLKKTALYLTYKLYKMLLTQEGARRQDSFTHFHTNFQRECLAQLHSGEGKLSCLYGKGRTTSYLPALSAEIRHSQILASCAQHVPCAASAKCIHSLTWHLKFGCIIFNWHSINTCIVAVQGWVDSGAAWTSSATSRKARGSLTCRVANCCAMEGARRTHRY